LDLQLPIVKTVQQVCTVHICRGRDSFNLLVLCGRTEYLLSGVGHWHATKACCCYEGTVSAVTLMCSNLIAVLCVKAAHACVLCWLRKP
jgi:hypothetical protein